MSTIRTTAQNVSLQWRPRAWSITIINPIEGDRVIAFNTHCIQIIDGVETSVKIPDEVIEIVLPRDALKDVTIISPITGEQKTYKFADIAEAFEQIFCDLYKIAHPEMTWEE